MIRTLTNVLKQDKEKFTVPKKRYKESSHAVRGPLLVTSVQDIIPVRSIWTDGIFMTGKNKFSKMYRFTDINYAVASREDKEGMFLSYSELLNSLDSGCTAKITINNRRLNIKHSGLAIPAADSESYRPLPDASSGMCARFFL